MSYKERLNKLHESITIPIEVGDTLLGGKFKNKRIVVKNISTNERGEPLINGKPLMKFRLIPKTEEKKKMSEEEIKQEEQQKEEQKEEQPKQEEQKEE